MVCRGISSFPAHKYRNPITTAARRFAAMRAASQLRQRQRGRVAAGRRRFRVIAQVAAHSRRNRG